MLFRLQERNRGTAAASKRIALMLAKSKESKEEKEEAKEKNLKVLEETAWVPPKVAISVWSETVKEAMEEAAKEVKVSESHRNLP